MGYAIETENLTKTYGKTFKALDGVSLQIKRGEVVGYVGPNGAGKTTTIKILTGLIRPTSGHAYVNGIDVAAKPKDALRSIGALIEVPGVYDYLTPHEMLTYFGRVYGMRRDIIDRRIKETLELVRLPDWEHKKTGSFSTGMLRRLDHRQSHPAQAGHPDPRRARPRFGSERDYGGTRDDTAIPRRGHDRLPEFPSPK